MPSTLPTRQSGIDNAKFILILLVCLGHFSRVIVVTQDSPAMRSLFLFIYAFHMPLFFFLSGLFARRERINWRKVGALVALGYLLKLVILAVRLLMGRPAVFDLFADTGTPWYLFSYASILALNHLLRRVDLRALLGLSLLAALLAGYFDWIGNFLYLSRTLVFFPFFLAGELAHRDRLMELLHRPLVRGLSGGALAVWAAVCAALPGLWPWVRVFTARFPYSQMTLPLPGVLGRLLWYPLAALLGLALLSLAPDRSLPGITALGARTMQIYFWHRPALYVLEYAGAAAALWGAGPAGQAAWLAIALVFPFLFGAKLFAFPTQPVLALAGRRK